MFHYDETPVPRTTIEDLDTAQRDAGPCAVNLGHVNTLGSGVPSMIRLMRQHAGRERDFELVEQQFLVRLWART